jgi:hypothetical protein
MTRADRLVMVGDLLVRGPDPRGVIEIVRDAGGLAVRGNHEDRLLRWRERGEKPKKGNGLGLEDLPLWIDLPEHGVRVVHAGVVPGVPIDRQDPRALMYMRSLGRFNEAVEERGKVLWGERYHGPPHVVFGHNAMNEVQIHPWATGIDTGCVYGGELTAMVLREGESPPPMSERRAVLVSVRARRSYADR